ncbi:MAG TPA: SIMPL domain-containing protein [Candidatus Saccharimonadales bacterium]|nr:SIMPL domain-containing protein [Candidatus Saccharimonadales bacterium]
MTEPGHLPIPTPDAGSIVVTGTGRVSVEPDVAELRLGVSIVRPTVESARSESATTMDAILEAVDTAGVARRDVRTAMLTVQPRYDYRDGKAPTLTGYELANVVAITVRDLGRLAEVVDGTLRAGATSMDGLSFEVADPAPAEREARLRAMAEARARADVLAEAAGLRILGVADITEGGAMPPPGPRLKAERMMLAASDVATPVEAGETEISVTVTVSYRVR